MLETKNNKMMKGIKQASIWVLGLVVIAVFPAIALADEVWSSNVGTIFYEKDIGNTAIFQYQTPGNPNGKRRIFLSNYVQDATGKRGTYFGYWTDDTNTFGCEVSVIDQLGNRTTSFGRVTVTFTNQKDGFADFEASMGTCFGEKVPSIRARSSNTVALPPQSPLPPTNGQAPKSAALKLQGAIQTGANGKNVFPLNRDDPASNFPGVMLTQAIYLDVILNDGTIGKFPDFQKDFASNIVFDDTSLDPYDIIQVIYWDDGKGGKYASQLTATGKGVGTAYLRVTFRNAPGVSAFVQADVISGK